MINALRIAAYIVLAAAALLVAGAAQSIYTLGHIPSGMKNTEILLSAPMLLAIAISVVLLKFLRDPKVQPPQAFAPNSPKSVEPSQKQP